MRALLTLCAVACAAVAFTGAAAAAAPPVSIVGCVYLQGGQATVPAGTDVSFRFGWFTRTQSLSELFLRTVTTTAAVDGNPVADAGSYWTDPLAATTPAGVPGYRTTWLYDTGITLGAGDSLTLTWDSTLSHPVTDGFSKPTSGSLTGGPVTCTVTGA